MKKKLAVLFPGLGYHTDKPLLYYSKKLARQEKYEIVEVVYGKMPANVKGNPPKMKEAFLTALQYAEEQLKSIDFASFEEVLFISKSVGTAVAVAYAEEKGISVGQILFTPLAETFQVVNGDGQIFKRAVAFHGTADPRADTKAVRTACEKCGVTLYLTEGANHSMETGNVQTDLLICKDIMEKVSTFLSPQ